MKLLYVESTLAIYGGIERVMTDKLNWLVEHGNCEVCLLVANQGNHPIVFPVSPKIKICDIGIMFHQIYRYSGVERYLKSYRLHQLFRKRLLDSIKAFSPDVIVFTRLDFASDVVSVKGDIPVVYESHNLFLSYKLDNNSFLHKIQIRLWHRALKKVQMIVALTNGDASEWKKRYPNVQLIPNVVHLNATDSYSDCSSKVVIFVGRFSRQKGFDRLLKIWTVIHNRYPDWSLHIYGGFGQEQNALVSEILQDDANIIIHKPTTDIIEKYKNSSILLMTSRYEPFGLVIPEAMSCGLPVVAFDCPYGPADILTNNIDGLLIEDGNINEYIEKLGFLIENEALRNDLGKNGIIHSHRYDASIIMPMWKQLFDNLLLK